MAYADLYILPFQCVDFENYCFSEKRFFSHNDVTAIELLLNFIHLDLKGFTTQ